MLFPATTLVSDCCRAIIVMDGSDYQCTKCLKHGQRGGTLADLAAPQVERERLEREVIDALKACHAKAGSSWDWIQPSGAYGPEIVGAWETLNERLFALIEFESQHLLNDPILPL